MITRNTLNSVHKLKFMKMKFKTPPLNSDKICNIYWC